MGKKTHPARKAAALRRNDAIKQSPPLPVAQRYNSLALPTAKVRDLVAPASINASEAELHWRGMGEFEHQHVDQCQRHACERNPFEAAEVAFRRGLQQGAHRLQHALEQRIAVEGGSMVLDAVLLQRIKRYVGVTLAHFRYPYIKGKGRRLGRCVVCDEPPWLDL